MNDSRDSAFFISSKQSLLTSSANVLRKLDDAVPNERDVRIFLQPSAQRPGGPDPHFVGIAALKMRDSSISSYNNGWKGRVSPYINTSSGGSLGSGRFCFNIFKVLSFKGKIPFHMLSVKSLSAPLTLPWLIIILNFKEIQFSYLFH